MNYLPMTVTTVYVVRTIMDFFLRRRDLLCLSLYLVLFGASGSGQTMTKRPHNVPIPPLIVATPPQIMAFRVGESIEIPCVASGEPSPIYKWKFNDKDFDPSGTDGHIAVQPGKGTLLIARPTSKDKGIYQCLAQNEVGVALTDRVDLRQAFLEPFQTTGSRRHQPKLGHDLTLRCVPPRSFPKGDVFWATISGGERFTPIDLTDRVTMDPEGNLHFANILPEDRNDGKTYACIVQNTVMRSIQQGEYATIEPQGQTIQYMSPSILWQPPTHQVALRGDIWRVKCVFSGSPTPRVDWARVSGTMPPRALQESFGQELVIENVQFEDMGRYECQGINDEAQVPIRRSFDLSVESAPYWTRMPESVDGADQDNAEFYCEALGDPLPANYWFINGIFILKIPADPRIVVENTKLTFTNLTKADAQVIQCNSTNKHGYIWTNAYLNVLSEPPMILTPPGLSQRVAAGQTVNLTCEVFGSPKPVVVWFKGSEQMTGGRFKVMDKGHLQITNVSLLDAAVYTCTATNRYGTVSATGSLVVRRKTVILKGPLDVRVHEGAEVKFRCSATTDLDELKHLQIDWMKNGQIIDYDLTQRIFKNDMFNSLTILGTISWDSGRYTCIASNGLDSDQASAQLVVQGRPYPPFYVKASCINGKNAEISWRSSSVNNNAPIRNFIIQFNTSFAPETWYDVPTIVSQNERRKVVTLSAWGNYSFRVLARNDVGVSEPSPPTREICRAEASVPDKNPDNVIGEGDKPDNLVIFWTPMPLIQQNGPGFKYIISWKRMDIPNAVEEVAYVHSAETWYYVVPEKQETYKPFEIRVKATNAKGDSSVEPKMVIGYSGEAVPLSQVRDVTVDPDSITANEAILKWKQVDTDPSVIRGFFRGYRVEFAKTAEWPDKMRYQDFILRDPLQYPRPRVKRQLEPEVRIKLKNLPPNSDINLQVRVLNKYYAGPSGSVFNLRTAEGRPGPPTMLQMVFQSSTYIDLKWEKPYEPNGILVGYSISYQTVNGLNFGLLQYQDPIFDPNIILARLSGLLSDTNYRVYVSAVSQRGKGESIFIQLKTKPSGVNVPPLIVEEPRKLMAFVEGGSVMMPCVATGEPQPMYKWTVNDKEYNSSNSGGRATFQPGLGTLSITSLIDKDEGVYQCFAYNRAGTALTHKTYVRRAIQEPFQPTVSTRHQPLLGHHLTLPCVQPRSFPKAEVFWATITDTDNITPINLTERVSMDPEGSLHFANILPEDGRDGQTYACIVQNSVLKTIQQGEFAIIEPQGQIAQHIAPSVMWVSPSHQMALRGDTWRVKCVFGGLPTPRVTWTRIEGPVPKRARQESFGQELVIENIQINDAGHYECQGINEETQVPIRKTLELLVESAPYWSTIPESMNANEHGNATFYCEGLGDPTPENVWYLDGVPISKMLGDPRRETEMGKLTFYNLTSDDTQVIQCNSTNKHGYIWTNAYLNVLPEPHLTKPPPVEEQDVSAGQIVNPLYSLYFSLLCISAALKSQSAL